MAKNCGIKAAKSISAVPLLLIVGDREMFERLFSLKVSPFGAVWVVVVQVQMWSSKRPCIACLAMLYISRTLIMTMYGSGVKYD